MYLELYHEELSGERRAFPVRVEQLRVHRTTLRLVPLRIASKMKPTGGFGAPKGQILVGPINSSCARARM